MATAFPLTAFALAWGLPALQDAGPVPIPPIRWSQSGPGVSASPLRWVKRREDTQAPVHPHRTLEHRSAAGWAEPVRAPLGFCRYHHTAPINSFFSLREGLAMLAELVSDARQAGGHRQCWWGSGERWAPGPSPSPLPTGSGELMGTPSGQLHPAVPGAA